MLVFAMTWLTLYLGFIFSIFLGFILFNPPTRVFLCTSAKLLVISKQWIIWCLVLGLIVLMLLLRHYKITLCIELIGLIAFMIFDLIFDQRAKQHLLFTKTIAEELYSGISSGLDIFSACHRLKQASSKHVQTFGTLMGKMFSLGIKKPSWVAFHPIWKYNAEFKQFLNILLDLIEKGGPLSQWLKRQTAFLAEKAYLQKKLSAKTAQIKLQFYVLTITSWLFMGLCLVLFPELIHSILNSKTCLLMIVTGVAIQALGIAWMKLTLRKIMEFR